MNTRSRCDRSTKPAAIYTRSLMTSISSKGSLPGCRPGRTWREQRPESIIFCTAVVYDPVCLDRLALGAVIRSAPFIGVALTLALVSTSQLSAKEHRSREVTREFQREHPCPSTGRTSGACPGYRRDHIKALACGGPDAVSNLQWQTVAAAKAKDRWERRACGR